MKKIFYCLITPCLFLTSCIALHNGDLKPSSVNLDTNNFAYIKTVSGSATAAYILGIGGNRDGLVKSSLNSFRSNLKHNQALVNISIDEQMTWFIIPILFQEKKVTVTADIIEFSSPGESHNIKRKDETLDFENNNLQKMGISIGSICHVDINGKMRKAKVLNYLEEGKFQLKLIYNNEIVTVSEDIVYFN